LVGGGEQLVRDGEAEHPGGRGVDDEFELARLHDRQIRRLCALEDTASVNSELPKRIDNVGSVAHQPADFSKVAVGKCRGDRVARRQIDQLGTATKPRKSASGRPRANVANAASISRLLLALRTWIC